VIHTLGIDNGSDLNADLLKNLAQDSGGTFKLTTAKEGIPAFLGDVLATHLYTRFAQLQLNLHGGKVITRIPLLGVTLRSDAATHLVFKIEPAEELKLKVQGWDVAKQCSIEQEIQLKPVAANDEDILRILGCAVVAPILSGKYKDWPREYGKAHADLARLKALGAPVASLIIAVEEYILSRNQMNMHGFRGHDENPHDSMAAFELGSSGGGVTSPQLFDLRANAIAQSQMQGQTIPESTQEEKEILL
jgi:hypothetical protein